MSLCLNNPLPNLPHNTILSLPDNINKTSTNAAFKSQNLPTNSKTQIVFNLHTTKPYTPNPFLITILASVFLFFHVSLILNFSNFKYILIFNTNTPLKLSGYPPKPPKTPPTSTPLHPQPPKPRNHPPNHPTTHHT